MTSVSESVRKIILDVQKRGDTALCELAKRFDRVALRPAMLQVSPGEIKKAQARVSSSVLKSLNECAKHIGSFARHEKSRLSGSWMKVEGSVRVGQLSRPVDSVGLYILGTLSLPVNGPMSAIPAEWQA